ncbi:unnamed protein product [Dracunculus medinensis]|uniref:PITH domain-containing protein n=1 Tax=Dracunculus medinensis TaxID=318479 RepID=A0A0N4UIH8_DRAME|nr:unnamed protein product [Dracunculus medinensis]
MLFFFRRIYDILLNDGYLVIYYLIDEKLAYEIDIATNLGQKHVNSIFSHGLNCLNTDRSNGDSAEYLDSDNNADKEKKDKILQVHGKPADCLNTNVGEQILQKVSIFLHGEDRLGAGNNYTEEKIHHANEDR